VTASASFYEPLGDDRFAATPHTAGPWDPQFQHAGPPAALLGRALERCEPRDGTILTRLTFDILGPVPVGEVEVSARIARPGRSVELLEGELRAGGRTAIAVRAWRTRVAAVPEPAGDPGAAPPSRPEVVADVPFGLDGFGYGRAVEMRFAAGGWDELGPATVWTRLRVPVVAGEDPTGLQRVLAVADSGNGVSAVVPLDGWLFINPELTLHVLRPPEGEWICLDATTAIAPGGAGLARSTLSDDAGPVAHGAQSLFVAQR
jgi:Thioesterase-like superfamily